MSEIKLKPCPFCGGEAKIATYDWGYSVKEYWCHCSSCNCSSSRYHSKEDAIAQWNTRKPMDNIVEKLEELKNRYSKEEFGTRGIIDKAINIVKQDINNGLE